MWINCEITTLDGHISYDTICRMIIDAIPATQTFKNTHVTERAVASFLKYIEQRLHVSVIRNVRGLPGAQELLEPFHLGTLLQSAGIIQAFGRVTDFPDEPQTKSWFAICNDPATNMAGGTTWDNDADALYATLAEALERYIWFTQRDYFLNPTRATASGIQKRGQSIAPGKIVGFSDEQRADRSHRHLRDDTEYLWIQGTSLIRGDRVYVPAQTVSGIRYLSPDIKEPTIRRPTTNGLATWHTQIGARLAGVLEVLERDAYMISWLNQLTLPRFSLDSLCSRDPGLAQHVAVCERYRLKTHVVQLLTDAPTHVVAVILEDMSGNAPRFSFGLRAHRSFPFAVQKATTEALRGRRAYRVWSNKGGTWDMSTPTLEIGHRERLYYWGVPEHAKNLEFLIQGPEIEATPALWENDSEEEHLRRVLRWCAEKSFECISVSLGAAAKNITPLHIEMVVMPELQPTYLTEFTQTFGGTRLKDVPAAFGYTPLKRPFADAPHPFS